MLASRKLARPLPEASPQLSDSSEEEESDDSSPSDRLCALCATRVSAPPPAAESASPQRANAAYFRFSALSGGSGRL